MICQNKSTPVGVRFLFHLLKRDASTRKFALRARECKRPTWMASPKQKHPCWGAISFSFIKKRSNHPEVCPSGKGNSPCRRLASGRTLCGEFANRACCRKRPTWVASPKHKPPCWGAFVLEAPPGIGPGIKVLQTSALPLGYGALFRIQKNVCSIYKKNERGVHSFF